MNLFDIYKRTDKSISGQSEPLYSFYNRRAYPGLSEIRNVLEAWFGRYPEGADKNELHRRFTSKDNVQHLSALFELSLHEILTRLGCELTPHPPVPNETGKHPDFLVKHPLGNFYLEAVVVADESTEETAKKRLIAEAHDAVDKLRSKDYSLTLEVEGSLYTPISKKDLKLKIQNFLNSLDYETVLKHSVDVGASDDKYAYSYQHEDLTLTFTPIPKTGSWREAEPGNLIGGWSGPGGVVSTGESIKKSLNGKSKKYGKLDLPYVVAVNVLTMTFDWAIPEALYGAQGIIYERENPGNSRFARITEGAWRYKSGAPRHTNMSAVLVLGYLTENSLFTAPICLHLHPRADVPLDTVLNSISKYLPGEDGRVHLIDGLGLSNILGNTNAPQGIPVSFKLGENHSEKENEDTLEDESF